MDTGRGVQPPLMYLPRPKKKQGYAEYPPTPSCKDSCGADLKLEIASPIDNPLIICPAFGTISFSGLIGTYTVHSFIVSEGFCNWKIGDSEHPVGSVSFLDGDTVRIGYYGFQVFCLFGSGWIVSTIGVAGDVIGSVPFQSNTSGSPDLTGPSINVCGDPGYSLTGGIYIITP